MDIQHQGGCSCGSIRYRVAGRPVVTTNCHCPACRKHVGAPFVTWSEFPAENVTVTQGTLAYFQSSDTAERGFCADCGTALTFAYIDGDTIDITTATLDDPAAFPPEDHIWTAHKLSWLDLCDGLPQHPRERR